jgi:peroxiredoxin
MRAWMIGAMAAVALAVPGAAQQTNGQQASNFRLTDINGRNVELSQFKGRTVVLEWHNPGCPFVKKHYDSSNMQQTQADAVAGGAVWLTINSGAPGKQGHMSPAEARKLVADQGHKASNYLLDPKGVVGKGYDAKTTPHLYIVNGDGVLVYQGGIDDKPTANVADIKTARNHVTAALNELRAGRPVSQPETRPYGCSVKYPET